MDDLRIVNRIIRTSTPLGNKIELHLPGVSIRLISDHCYQIIKNSNMTSYILLQSGQSGAGSSLTMLFPLLIFLVFFVFFIFIPQNRQKKQAQKFLESLKEGMDVYTSAGIVGRITKIDEKTVRLMVDDKTFLRVLKTTVSGEFKG